MGVQRIAPVTIRGFAIRIDRNRLRKPDSRGVKVIATVLGVGRIICFLIRRIARIERRVVELWVGFKRSFVGRNRFIHITAREGRFAFANGQLRGFDIRKGDLSAIRRRKGVESHARQIAVIAE